MCVHKLYMVRSRTRLYTTLSHGPCRTPSAQLPPWPQTFSSQECHGRPLTEMNLFVGTTLANWPLTTFFPNRHKMECFLSQRHVLLLERFRQKITAKHPLVFARFHGLAFQKLVIFRITAPGAQEILQNVTRFLTKWLLQVCRTHSTFTKSVALFVSRKVLSETYWIETQSVTTKFCVLSHLARVMTHYIA
jgi:hypothetical protein